MEKNLVDVTSLPNDPPTIIQPNGDQYWMKNGYISRDSGPAIIKANGEQLWRRTNDLNELDSLNDQPALISVNGDKSWYKNGKLDRESGPAVELANGDKKWYRNNLLERIEYANGDIEIYEGKDVFALRNFPDGHKEFYKNEFLHNVDAPAVEFPNGNKYWYKDGLLDRVNGPAIELANGDIGWYENGVHIPKSNVAYIINSDSNEWIEVEKKDVLSNTSSKCGVIYGDNDITWYKNGVIHRDNDLPAVIEQNIVKEDPSRIEEQRKYGEIFLSPKVKPTYNKYWYKDGTLHRVGGPAVEMANGDKHWYENGVSIQKLNENAQPSSTTSFGSILTKIRNTFFGQNDDAPKPNQPK